MSINWIATNPGPSVGNKALRVPMNDEDFECLMRTLIHVIRSIHSNYEINCYFFHSTFSVLVTMNKNLRHY
jgi:hypothetical protein